MDDVSIKILDALFDLCDGENYVILEKEELTSRVSYHDFAVDELTEILESLAAEQIIDLKYADNREFCVAMKTKGRSFIKQSRERMQHLIEEHPEIAEVAQEEASIAEENRREEESTAEANRQKKEALEEARERLIRAQEDKLEEAKIHLSEAISPADRAVSRDELRRVKRDIRLGRERVADLDEKIREVDDRGRSTSNYNLARGYSVHASTDEEKQSRRDTVREKKVLWAALLGSAIGATIINLIFLIIFLVKFGK